MRILYVSLMRFPSEKAHSLQIMQNCEAFVQNGATVTLAVSRRHTAPALRAVDPFAHYGVEQPFEIVRISGFDLYPLARGNPHIERPAFYVHWLTYALFLLLFLFQRRDKWDVIYSRDEYLLAILRWFYPREKLAYEAHLFSQTERGARMQTAVVRACGSIIAITPHLRTDLIAERGATSSRIITAHDGVRAARFADLPAQGAARAHLNWPSDAFVVGFVGRLHMLNVDKGVGTLLEAVATVRGAHLALVGGPEEMVESLRERWQVLGRSPDEFHYTGQLAPAEVPAALCAFDVCAMPHPRTTQFARYTSPLKLFEYMAAGRAIVASDLPGWADVVVHERDALLVAPGDVDALREAITRLQNDLSLREKLSNAARQRAIEHYTWSARTKRILDHMQAVQAEGEKRASVAAE